MKTSVVTNHVILTVEFFFFFFFFFFLPSLLSYYCRKLGLHQLTRIRTWTSIGLFGTLIASVIDSRYLLKLQLGYQRNGRNGAMRARQSFIFIY